MPSKTKEDAMNMILAVIRDNPGITSKKVIDIIPVAPSTARVCITMLIKKKNISMIKRGTERVLYTPQHIAENNIKGESPKPPAGSLLSQKPVNSILESQLKFNQLFQAAR